MSVEITKFEQEMLDAVTAAPAEQHSEQWFADRLGKATASRAFDVISRTKSGYSAKRHSYAVELATERLTGQRVEIYETKDMRWGTQTEPAARDRYCEITGSTVVEVGMVKHPEIPNSGASPDGLVGEIGLIEIKCPRSSTMFDTVLTGKIPERYQAQMNWQIACTGRKWCDFVMFDPRLPAASQIWIVRHERDAEVIEQLEEEVAQFLEYVEDLTTRFLEVVK